MGIINTPIPTNQVEFDFNGRFCEYEAWWIPRKERICLAHLNEGRVFTCWCDSLEHAKESTDCCAHRCEDAEKPKSRKAERPR